MSFKQNDTVTLSNYEEYFILYTDNELSASQKADVEAFVLQHPQLADELEALLSTKLPLHELSFSGKEDLLSPAMKLNTVDEALLLYVDDELPLVEKAAVAGRIQTDADYALQHSLLRQTKLNADDNVLHPNKKELYRHEKRTVPLGFWMRIAAAVILLLIGTRFFSLNKSSQQHELATNRNLPVKHNPVVNNRPTIVQQVAPTTLQKDEIALTKQATVKPLRKDIKTLLKKVQSKNDEASSIENSIATNRKRAVRINANLFATEQKIITPSLPVNEIITHTSVTSLASVRNTPVNPDEPIATDGDYKPAKKTPARGFFRKVSRFIERNTGIGTVNADNELLVGAVALKLK